jgi:hypothetical protein
LVIDPDEDLSDVLFCRFIVVRCRSLADINRWKPIVNDSVRAIEVTLGGVLISFVHDTPLITKRVHEVATNLGFGRFPFHNSVMFARNSGSLRIAASATSNRPSRGLNAIVILRSAPSLPTTSTPRITA